MQTAHQLVKITIVMLRKVPVLPYFEGWPFSLTAQILIKTVQCETTMF